MEIIALGLGSNLGRRLFNLKKAVKFLYSMPGFDFLAFSSVYETEPWGFKNQNNYLNCAVIGLYRSSARDLFVHIKEIEKKTGRKSRERWHPREIDIDILFFGNRIIKYKDLVIPHPQMRYRNFVLAPLAEIVPGLVHPEFKKQISTLLESSGDSGKVIQYKRNLSR
jgi:dihydroneopterin aldolase/2-amino-4-hydroxy-6-hydroxymethyldihydropteridine diphosphokinase